MASVNRKGAALIVATALAFGAASCGESTSPRVRVAALTFQETADSLDPGGSLQLAVQALDASNKSIANPPVSWSSSDPSVVTVTPSGSASGKRPGSAVIAATADGVVANVTVVVLPPVSSVRMTPSVADVGVTRSVHTQAIAFDAGGARLSRRTYTYRSADPSIATVSTTGIISGVGPGSTSVVASTAGASVTIPVSVARLAAGQFRIDLRFLDNVSPALRAAATQAAARWEQVITGALVPYRVTVPADTAGCGKGIPAVDETVTNMIIFVRGDSIDGRSNTAGLGGPCVIRDDAPQLTALGELTVDTADVTALAANSILADLVQHEMGHILGIGTTWIDPFFPNTTTGQGGSDPLFIARRGRVASAELGFTADSSLGVPIENTGGEGTRDGHWRASVFGHELMTGTLHLSANPLSLVTVEALGDLGYPVVPQAADDFSALNANNPTTFASPSAARLVPLNDIAMQLNDVVIQPRFTTTRDGVLRRIPARSNTGKSTQVK